MLISYLQKQKYLLVGAIAVAMFAFIGGDVFHSVQNFVHGTNPNNVGEIAGKAISYAEFNERVEQTRENFKRQMGGQLTPQMAAYAQDQAWNQLVQEIVFKNQTEKVGIEVGDMELNDAVVGPNPDPQVRQIFADPNTGQFDPKAVRNFITNMQGQQKDQWIDFEHGLRSNRAIQKYVGMVTGAMYATSLEVNQLNKNNTQLATAQVAVLPYASLADDAVKVEQSDIDAYYKANKYKYKQKNDQRTLEYVVVDVTPSKADSAAALKDIEKLAEDFKAATNDSLFYMANADTKMPLTYQKKAQLDARLDEALFNASVGTTYGPYLDNGAYKVAKLMSAKNMPDSVKARHILISAAKGGLTPEGLHRADSLKQVIASGKTSFADAAKAISDDTGSAVKGGELGYFGRGMMVPSFEQAAFDGKSGGMAIVQSQFGTHLIQIQDQKNSSRAVQIAVVDRVFEPSNASRNEAFAKANGFVKEAKASKSFDEAATKLKLTKRISDNLNAIGAGSDIPGLENSREIIKWAFKAKRDAISDEAFEVGDKYVVAHLLQIREKGFTDVEYLKSEIEVAVRQQKKAEQLKAKAAEALKGASDLNAVAGKLGVAAQPYENLSFNNPVIAGQGVEQKLFGAMMGTPVGKIGQPVAGDKGVYIYKVDAFTGPAPLADLKASRQSVIMMQQQAISGGAAEALQDLANVEDNRGTFY